MYLTLREGDRILYIYAVESSRRLIARTAVGDRMPMHCTGVGKAILGHLPEAEVRGILDRVGMPRVTPNTITDLDVLLEELRVIHERGYSYDNSENEIGNYCVGAPIFGAQGQVIGGCSIAGTDPEIIGSRAAELSRALTSTCLDISRNLGYVPASVFRGAYAAVR